jgi:hypothetical protein
MYPPVVVGFRHCEERSDEAMYYFAALAMTAVAV